MNYTRTSATELRTGDRIVLFHELTGDQRTVTLAQRKGYEGDGRYWEFHTIETDERIGMTPDTEVMRCE